MFLICVPSASGQSIFTKITSGGIVTDAGSWAGCAWGDFDGDGFIDLFITTTADANGALQRNALYHNNRDGSFTRVITGAIVSELGDWRGCSWADFDNDGQLDLFVTRVDGTGFPDQAVLYRQNDNGAFTKLTAGILGNAVVGGFSEECVWSDYDRDGFLDIYVARNSGTDWLLHNNGDGTLRMAESSVGIPTDNLDSYGAMWGDYDNDGWPDLFVAVKDDSNLHQANLLYRNHPDARFSRIINGDVVTDNEHSIGGTWVDYDNDGYLDLFVVNGLSMAATNSLYHNNGDGTFTKKTTREIGSIVGDSAFFVSCTWGDYDNDGFLDLLVARGGHRLANNLLYRNKGNSNAWLKVKLVGTVSNRSAVGAKVRVKATIGGRTFWQLREITAGNGFASSPLEAHFGLGNATQVDLMRIEWPSGTVQLLTNLTARESLTVTEPPQLRALGRRADGSFQLSLTGGLGINYEVETSGNLVIWTPWTNVTNTNRTVTLSATNMSRLSQVFYRVRRQ